MEGPWKEIGKRKGKGNLLPPPVETGKRERKGVSTLREEKLNRGEGYGKQGFSLITPSIPLLLVFPEVQFFT